VRDLGRALIWFGAVTFVVGAVLYLARGWIWLPGDLIIERKNFTFVFPIMTCLIVSVVLTLLFRFFGK
jgi:hypothetical protein